MVQMETQSAGSARAYPHQEFYLILYPKELEDEVIQTLEATGVPGYTEMPKMVGRGRHIRHFDNPVWPGATGAVFTVILPAALPGIITGVMLALARIAGETAPLLFTSFNNRYFTTKLTQPISSLTVQVFTYAISPYADWHRQAWAGALVLVLLVFLSSLIARTATRRLEGLSRG